MMSMDQLAKKAYQAFKKEFSRATGEAPLEWDDLPDALKASWLAAAKQLWAEFAALH